MLDKQAESINGLSADNFTIKEDSKPVSIFNLEPVREGNHPIALVLAVDKSGSMMGPKIEIAKQAASDFINRLAQQDQVALIAFDDKVEVVSPMNSSRGTMLSDIKSIQIGNKTAILDATLESLKLLSSAQAERKAVILVTDGDEICSKTTGKECLTWASRENIPIFTIAMDKTIKTNLLERLASQSGGLFYFAPKADDLLLLYQKISQQLKNQYLLNYRALNTSPDKAWHKIDIDVSYSGTQLSTSREYLADLNPISSTEIIKQARSQERLIKIANLGIAGALAGLLLAFIVGLIIKLIFRKRPFPWFQILLLGLVYGLIVCFLIGSIAY